MLRSGIKCSWNGGYNQVIDCITLVLGHRARDRAESRRADERESPALDTHQLQGERIGERAALVSLLRERQHIAVELVNVNDEYARTHHRRVLRGDGSH